MKKYDVMNEERVRDLSMPNLEDIAPEMTAPTIHISLKITDSDIRSIHVNPEVETIASLKSKVPRI